MVKVLLYAYATGVFSSRGIARALEEDVAFRVLAAGNFPQHRTLCEFRRRHLEDFRALFVEVVRLAQALGLARLGKLSIDGTKVRANASKRKAMSYDRMQEENGAWQARSRRCYTRGCDRRESAYACPGAEVGASCRRPVAFVGGRSVWRRSGREGAVGSGGSLNGRRRAGSARSDRNPTGGPPYKRAYGEPDERRRVHLTRKARS